MNWERVIVMLRRRAGDIRSQLHVTVPASTEPIATLLECLADALEAGLA